MCDPATVAIAVGAVATVAQGYQAQQQGEFREGVSKFNARQLENEATRTRNVGVEEENRQREATAQLRSRQRAQLGAAGVELTSGSALQLQTDTETLGEVDALRIRSNFQQQAESLEDQSEIERSVGKAAARSGQRAFTTSIFAAAGGAGIAAAAAPAGTVASKWFTPRSSASLSGTSSLAVA